jgi:HK97 family phage major capsid protein
VLVARERNTICNFGARFNKSRAPVENGRKQNQMNVSSEVINAVAAALQEKHGFATVSQLDRLVADVLRKTEERHSGGKIPFSLSTMIRGLRAMRGETINTSTAEADIQYVKALTTGATPGSYLVPTIQADEIIQYLSIGGIARSAGVRIWPMNGIQKMTVPTALMAPLWVWMAQNSQQTPTDPNLGQMAFDLKERRALTAVPNQLLATSVPAFDSLLGMLLGLGAAEHEDTAMFNTTTVSGGPTALFAAAGVTMLNTAGSANGGNISYADIIAVLAQAAAVKAKGPFVWIFSPRTFFQRILGLVDLQSRPITIPTLTEGLAAAPAYRLMGWPVFVTPFLLENEALGSGTNQAHAVFANPSYIHIAQDNSIEIAVSVERYFDSAQTAIRGIQHEDFGFAPAAGIICLRGIN